MPATVTILDEISGKPREIQNPLQAEDIRVGQVLWYDGFSSFRRWDCPAIITAVDQKKRQFLMLSFDDMREQHQWYDFDSGEDAPINRQTMRVVEPSVVDAYLKARRENLEEHVKTTRQANQEAISALAMFDLIRSKFKF